MLSSNAPKKLLMIFTLVMMILSLIINYPIVALGSDDCQDCCSNCQCPKSSRGEKTPLTHSERPSCDNLSACLDESSSVPYNIIHCNNRIEKQTRNDAIISEKIIISAPIIKSPIEHYLDSLPPCLYVTISQYRSPPSL